jgi:lysophospholipase L1-like esterase
MIRVIWLVLVCIMVSGAKAPDIPLRLFLIGDSTIADKLPVKAPETGWGTPFKTYFHPPVEVHNHAKNGRSTRTFLEEGLWEPIYSQLKAGDYVFIQFGHNDQSESKPDRYTPPADYVANLKKFVMDTRSKGAQPVLLTPVSRRKFDKAGVQVETHGEYPDLVRKVAQEMQVPLIDLDPMSRKLYQEIGEEASKRLFLQLAPGEHANYPEGVVDNTHFSGEGAEKIAQLVLNDLSRVAPELEPYIKKL